MPKRRRPAQYSGRPPSRCGRTFQASWGSTTQTPWRITPLTSKASSSRTRSASLPGSREPTLSSRPSRRAGLADRAATDVLDRDAVDRHRALEGAVQGEGGAGDRAALHEAGHALADLDLQRAEQIAAVADAGGVHRVGDERDPARARVTERQFEGGRVQMGAVVDQLDGHPLVLQQGGDRAGGAVPERRHRVEEVGGDGGSRLDGLDRLLVRGVRVPDGRDHAVFGEQPYGVQAAGQFGREGDHPGLAARRVDQLADLGRVRVAQQRLGVRALAARGDERALEVDAGQVALFGQFGQQPGLADEDVHVVGDGGGDEGGGAVQAVGVDALRTSCAEPEKEAPPPPWLCRSTKPGTSQWPDTSSEGVLGGPVRGLAAMLRAVDDHAAVGHGPGGQHHPAAGQHLRGRAVRGHVARGRSCAPRRGGVAIRGLPPRSVELRRSQASRPAPRHPALSPRAAGTISGSFWKVTRAGRRPAAV